MQSTELKVGIFTSGGDAPGMNACIRASVRTLLSFNCVVTGFIRGYEGLIDDDRIDMNARSVSNILQRGGTILRTARSERFRTVEGRKRAYENLLRSGVNHFIAIGGDGTFKGAQQFMSEYPDIRIVGVPGTIDNDLNGTDYTLGFDTALNTTVQAIDKIKDTAASHDRLFFIEVMGRDSGCIALWAGIAGGAEAILLPEVETDFEALKNILQEGGKKNKSSNIVIVAEGEKNGGAAAVAARIQELLPDYETKVTVLGHVQRGGSPTCFDRMLATRLGVAASEALLEGLSGVMLGIKENKTVRVPFRDCTKQQNPLDPELLRIAPYMII